MKILKVRGASGVDANTNEYAGGAGIGFSGGMLHVLGFCDERSRTILLAREIITECSGMNPQTLRQIVLH